MRIALVETHRTVDGTTAQWPVLVAAPGGLVVAHGFTEGIADAAQRDADRRAVGDGVTGCVRVAAVGIGNTIYGNGSFWSASRGPGTCHHAAGEGNGGAGQVRHDQCDAAEARAAAAIQADLVRAWGGRAVQFQVNGRFAANCCNTIGPGVAVTATCGTGAGAPIGITDRICERRSYRGAVGHQGAMDVLDVFEDDLGGGIPIEVAGSALGHGAGTQHNISGRIGRPLGNADDLIGTVIDHGGAFIELEVDELPIADVVEGRRGDVKQFDVIGAGRRAVGVAIRRDQVVHQSLLDDFALRIDHIAHQLEVELSVIEADAAGFLNSGGEGGGRNGDIHRGGGGRGLSNLEV